MSAAQRDAVITLDGVGKSYGAKQVLATIDLEIGAGQSFALLGHNGAGKTTLIKLMLGLVRPTTGQIRVLGGDPTARHAADLRRTIGFLPETIAFHETMTGREALDFYAKLKGVSRRACADLLARIGLAAASDQRIQTYSKGMRQRLGLAQALLGAPRLLFLDEPTNGLDPMLRQQFYGILADLHRQGCTVLISTHALSEIETRADRLAILKEGRLIAHGTVSELRRRTGLAVHIHVRHAISAAAALTQALQDAAIAHTVGDSVIEITCAPGDKLNVLGVVASSGASIDDIEVSPPRLEQIYHHLTDRGATP